MKFKAEATIEILDQELLEIVNDQQEWDNLEKFDSLEEIPMELIWMALDAIDYISEEITNYSSPDDFKVTVIQ